MPTIVKKTVNGKVQLSNSQVILQLSKFKRKDESIAMSVQITKIDYDVPFNDKEHRFINIGQIYATTEQIKEWLTLALQETQRKV